MAICLNSVQVLNVEENYYNKNNRNFKNEDKNTQTETIPKECCQ